MNLNDLPPLSAKQTLSVSAGVGAGILGAYYLSQGRMGLGAPMLAAGLYAGFWYGREVMQYRAEQKEAANQRQALIQSLAPRATAAQADRLIPFQRSGDVAEVTAMIDV